VPAVSRAFLSGRPPGEGVFQAHWPPEYRRSRWIDMQDITQIAVHNGDWVSTAEILDRDS
jgi:hypothetical protein